MLLLPTEHEPREAVELSELVRNVLGAEGARIECGGDGGVGRRVAVQGEQFVHLVHVADQLIVRADLPGLSKDDIDLDLREDTLTICGQRREEREESRERYAYSERSYGSFAREIPLPGGISPEQVDASFENGVLEVKMKIPEESRTKRRKLQIRSGSSTETPGASTSSGSRASAKAAPQEQPNK